MFLLLTLFWMHSMDKRKVNRHSHWPRNRQHEQPAACCVGPNKSRNSHGRTDCCFQREEERWLHGEQRHADCTRLTCRRRWRVGVLLVLVARCLGSRFALWSVSGAFCCRLWCEQVARYFGFAQQVGLELGSLMPERLRHTMAFVSSLVTMTLNLDQVSRCRITVTGAAVSCRSTCICCGFLSPSDQVLPDSVVGTAAVGGVVTILVGTLQRLPSSAVHFRRPPTHWTMIESYRICRHKPGTYLTHVAGVKKNAGCPLRSCYIRQAA